MTPASHSDAPRDSSRAFHLVAVGTIAALSLLLYLPYLSAPTLFDDKLFFSGRHFAYYATHPFGLTLRAPAYFTLAVTQVLDGSIVGHRIVSLSLHIACAVALYAVAYSLLRIAGKASSRPDAAPRAAMAAAVAAALFAVHPVAVYGAAYLVQRTIVLATLGSLLSLLFFVRGLETRRYAWAVWAGAAYSIAVLSKEHAVLLPLAAIVLLAVVRAPRPFALRYAALYGASCFPAGALVVALSTWLIGNAYEPAFAGIASQIEAIFGLTAADLTWPLSVATQAGLFFRYAALWLWPDASRMSIDMRVDFLQGLAVGWQIAKVLGFAGALAAWAYLLRRRGAWAVAGFGACYMAILFLVELSTLRFQEPFVLYRSYLWGPGMLLVIAAALYQLKARHAAVAALVIVPVVAFQANDRLHTFQYPLQLWEDAVSKLPSKTVPWGSRTLYNLGREYLYADRPDDAIAVTETCIKRYPGTFQCVFGRASVSLHLGRYEEALSYMSRALALQPDEGVAHHHMGVILEKLGHEQAAIEHYRRAYDLGFTAAELQLQRVRASKAAYSSAVAR